LTGLDH